MIDDKVIKTMVEENENLVRGYLKLILDFFKGDETKAYLWWTTPNPMFGNISPFCLMWMGRGSKVFSQIEVAIYEGSE